MKSGVIPVLLAALLLGGCSGMSYTAQRALSGGALRRRGQRPGLNTLTTGMRSPKDAHRFPASGV